MILFDYSNYLDSIKKQYTDISDVNLLYHYTSINAISKILIPDRISFIFSNIYYLNDISEGKNIVDLYKGIVCKLKKQRRIPISFLKKIENYTPSHKKYFQLDKNNIYEYKSESINEFCCSFSLNGNSLDLWRYYLKNNSLDGYCICFSSHIFDDCKPESENIISLSKIIYEDKIKKKIIENAIINCYDFYNKQTEIADSRYINFLYSFLDDMQFSCKDECFSNEEEVRAKVNLPLNQTGTEIKFRDNNGLLIPYIEIDTDKKYFESARLSPVMSNDAVESTKFFLRYRGYPDNYVDKSNLPIRY
jgi:hypothetical protein